MAVGQIQNEDDLRAFIQQTLRGSNEAKRIRQLQGAEPWHLVGAAPEPLFQNGWGNFGGGLSVVAFYKAGDRVYLKGQAAGGTAGAAIFRLPYVPLERLDPPITANGAASAATIVTNGDVIPVAAAGNVRVSLDGISFRLS